jgi:hypothetical protein
MLGGGELLALEQPTALLETSNHALDAVRFQLDFDLFQA